MADTKIGKTESSPGRTGAGGADLRDPSYGTDAPPKGNGAAPKGDPKSYGN